MNAARITSRFTSIGAVLIAASMATSCSKGDAAPASTAAATLPVSTTAAAPASAPVSAPASAAVAPAADATAAAPAVASPATTAVAAAAPPAPPTAEEREAERKKAQIEWALRQDEIKNDPRGQWAKQATASSTFNDVKGNAPYAASQATGEPNVQQYSTTAQAWSSRTPDSGIEWLDLTFAKPVHATAIRVRESSGSGAVIKIEVFDDKGAPHSVWSGSDPTKELNYLIAEFPKTAFKTNRVKLTLATNVVQGWNQIDAVQLIGTEQ